MYKIKIGLWLLCLYFQNTCPMEVYYKARFDKNKHNIIVKANNTKNQTLLLTKNIKSGEEFLGTEEKTINIKLLKKEIEEDEKVKAVYQTLKGKITQFEKNNLNNLSKQKS